MPYLLRTFNCGDCGAQVAKRAALGATVFCVPCNIEHSAECQRQLNARSGPYYERWLWANRLAVRRRKNWPRGYHNVLPEYRPRSSRRVASSPKAATRAAA